MLYLSELNKRPAVIKRKRVLQLVLILVCFVSLKPVTSVAQALNNKGILNLSYLSYNNKIPEGLLSERTVVLVEDKVPSPAKKKKEAVPSWKSFATRAHETFAMLGIDPVAYYNLDLVLSGRAVTRSFAEDINGRAITYAIILSRELTASNDTLFTLTLSALSKDDFFFSSGQEAFQLQATGFNELMGRFIRAVSGSGVEKTNFLILDIPEFFNDTKIFTSRRFESYNPDLKLDKLAVPLFEERMAPMKVPPGMSREEVTAKVNAENQKIKEANEKLADIMKGYPFSSGPVDYSEGEAGWKKKGNQFALLSIHGKAETVRELLEYKSVDDQPTYTTTRMVGGQPVTQEMPKTQEVYKFYIKHLPSGEIYLGDYWDAAPTWEQALENFIENLKFALKVPAN